MRTRRYISPHRTFSTVDRMFQPVQLQLNMATSQREHQSMWTPYTMPMANSDLFLNVADAKLSVAWFHKQRLAIWTRWSVSSPTNTCTTSFHLQRHNTNCYTVAIISNCSTTTQPYPLSECALSAWTNTVNEHIHYDNHNIRIRNALKFNRTNLGCLYQFVSCNIS